MGTVIVALCAAIVIGWYWRRNLRRGSQRKLLPRQGREPYACVAIQFEDDACAAVKALAGVRFLRKLAPLVPLDDCDCVVCLCRYRHYSDRRHHDRRDSFSRSGSAELAERRINRADRRRNVLSA
jgi:hypothetical protein